MVQVEAMRKERPEIPDQIGVLIVGGGTGGATLAGIIAKETKLSVVLLEAGPDYGPIDGNRWPRDLLDARELAYSHDWGYEGVAHPSQGQPLPFHRARVIGGCSAHNYCIALIGHRRDYDHWAELGNPGWDWDSVRPAFERAKGAMAIRIPQEPELTPYHAAYIEAARSFGIPRVTDLNHPDESVGIAPIPFNIYDGIRWNSAFAYLDPVRERPNLTIVDHVLVDRVVVENGRVVAVVAVIGGERRTVAGGRVVLCAGAYASPCILMRSGIGAPDRVRTAGVTPAHELPGVGMSLCDHPFVHLGFEVTERLAQSMEEFEASHWRPTVQALAKAQSPGCREAFDLHLNSSVRRVPETGVWEARLTVAAVLSKAAGSVKIVSPDPAAAPVIDHAYLSDAEGHDLRILVDGIQLGREVMERLRTSGSIGSELTPGRRVKSRAELAAFVEQSLGTYCHPSCTCRMGPVSDPMAVVDHTGKVHGIDGLYICDASIFPALMRANTNVPTAVVAEHLARGIGRIDRGGAL